VRGAVFLRNTLLWITGIRMSRKLILEKLAKKLSNEELIKLAVDKLDTEDIEEISKVADSETPLLGKMFDGLHDFTYGVSDLTHSSLEGLSHILNAINHPIIAKIPIKERLQSAGSNIMESISRNSGTAKALGGGLLAATPIALYLAHKALSGGDSGKHRTAGMPFFREDKLSSASLTPQVREELDKLAEDPAIKLAFWVLAQKGLI
jgi:hypothetical protein